MYNNNEVIEIPCSCGCFCVFLKDSLFESINTRKPYMLYYVQCARCNRTSPRFLTPDEAKKYWSNCCQVKTPEWVKVGTLFWNEARGAIMRVRLTEGRELHVEKVLERTKNDSIFDYSEIDMNEFHELRIEDIIQLKSGCDNDR